jgi:dTDP-4-dehydrorhamnose reductase
MTSQAPLRILVTGALGQVGWELQRSSLAGLGRITAIDLADLDLTDAASVRALVRELRPDVLVNPAAYTAVDKAESQPELAMAVNGVAPGVMAEEMAKLGGLMIHYSTDYVFDGTKPSPWVEDDIPNPLSVYGRTKLAGEQAVKAAGGAHVILRTSWVYGRRGGNFMLTMIRLAKERDELRVVADQHGAPTWCRTLAEGTAEIVRRSWVSVAVADRARAMASGVYHFTNGGATTWQGFAKAIIAKAPELPDRRHVKVTPIATADYPLPAKRPANSLLDNSRLARTFGIRQVSWEQALHSCIAGPD